MRNIFLFIGRYANLLLFVLLQAVSIYLIVSYSKYHQAAFGSVANVVTGGVNKKVNAVEYYFKLRTTNDSLLVANEKLYNELQKKDPTNDLVVLEKRDTLRIDSVVKYQTIQYFGAKVVANSVASQNNYVVLSGPAVKNFAAQMAVVDVNNSVVGKITEVNGNYAVVMSLLHKDSRISGRLLKTGETGTLIWDGKEPNILTLTGISKSVVVKVDDTIITSGFSTAFPAGLKLGKVSSIVKESETGNFKIMVKTDCNFYNLQYGYAIRNKEKDIIDQLINKQKTIE